VNDRVVGAARVSLPGGLPHARDAGQVTGGYFYHQQPRTAHPAARDLDIQDRLLRYCAALTGVTL
jgi:hypothetical protein